MLHFWSESKIRRTIKDLEDMGVLLSKRVNANKWNQTKWYSVNLERLQEILNDPLYTNISTKGSLNFKKKKWTDRSVQNEPIITINNYTIINSSNVEEEILDFIERDVKPTPSESQVAQQMIQAWNDNVPNVQVILTDFIATSLVTLLKDHFENNLEDWIKYTKSVASSRYLMGKLNKNFKPQFGFLTREDVVIKVLNGGYGVKADKPCKQEEAQQAEPQVPQQDVPEE
ncbi:hypothetical protein, partial [Candidatus Cyrtobacter comes]|uniref:hypothetical protein n=1 Tax=Candidatus Cyrtobacter comes TaxID=675776 RepID=UPI002ACE89EB